MRVPHRRIPPTETPNCDLILLLAKAELDECLDTIKPGALRCCHSVGGIRAFRHPGLGIVDRL